MIREATDSLIEVADPAAYREVFAERGEGLLLAIPSSSLDLDLIGHAARQVAEAGRKVRWLVLGGNGRADDGSDRGFITPLPEWSHVLAGAIASVADGIVVFDAAWKASADLPRPRVIFRPQDRSSPPHKEEGERTVFFDPRHADSLGQAVLEAIFRGEGQGQGGSTRGAKTKEFVLFNDWGIGDELLLSAVGREIVRTYPEIRLWIRLRHGFRLPECFRRDSPPPTARAVETIYQNTVLYGPESHSSFPGHLVQQMLDKFALDTGLPVSAQDVRPEVVLESSKLRPRSSRTVVVHSKPNPRLPSKDWGSNRWSELCEILHKEGKHIVQVGAHGEPLLPHAEDLRGTPPAELPEILAGAGAVVCVVGFLMHLAAATRTPAVVIYGGREHPSIDGYPDHLHLSSEPLPCRGRWGCHLAPDRACPHGMKCMENLRPDLVAYEVHTLLEATYGESPA